ncbi:CPBP family intramembrane metalloprotease [Alkalibaculum sp. M08DMB]|uniref:CPBP family intramembrane metalloprotease n=1 Tax=Alkalibaculum sporogenes TaxID=2655001 RepID=A0A6A7KCS5_9FIRM|nr:type II CAAX endopeptidase family protein [Alkalibaculum sporogenes]MPW27111.1 CPBP family intramembrane metalloprotease [Alkalibaculum sporogenes]
MNQIIDRDYKKGLWIFLVFFIIFLILNILIGIYFYEFALYHQIIDILIPCLLFLIITRKPILSTLKLNKKVNKKSIIIIFQLFLISFLLKIGINYLVMLTGTIDPSEVTTQVIEMVPNLFTFFIAVAIIPVFLEEVIIRGIILNYFKNTNIWQAAVITGLLFGMMHVDLGQFGYTTVLGIIMAAIVIITGSLWGSILFHFLNNFLTFIFIVILQAIERIIPNEYIELLAQTDNTQVIAENSIPEQIMGIVFALLCLGVGVFLSIHFIKKLQKANPIEEVLMDKLDDTEIQVEENKEITVLVSWKALFLNAPFVFIVVIYIGMNLLIRL